MKPMAKASSNIQDLTGNGLEFLTDDSGEWIRAEFYNGEFIRAAEKADASELERDTIKAA